MNKIDKMGVYVKEPKPKNMTHNIYGKFVDMLNFLSYKNSLAYTNGRPVKELYLLKYLGLKNIRAFDSFIKKLIDNNMIMKNKIDYIFINPTIVTHNKFKWSKNIFDLFENSIKNKMSKFEYLKIKSNWYKVNHLIVINRYEDIGNNVSGIYRLYKNKKIVYIGKSKHIRNRLTHHRIDIAKNFDSFDFTMLNNNSDKNIYELYYIDKYKPIYNNDCIEDSKTNIILKDLIFTKIIKIRRQNE